MTEEHSAHEERTLDDTTARSRGSAIFAERDGHSLEFDDIKLVTKTKDAEKNPPKEILSGITSHFAPKTLTAIMGPSGSGKTSLLKTLIGRISKKTPKLGLTGEVRLNGSVVDPSDIKFRREIAYVEQDVSIPATATAREAIFFSARLRLPKSMSDKEIADIVDEILDSLGLTECADRMIGGGLLMKGGLSGGEKKRVQCGVELVTNPEIVVLDEPTSGLDSYSAQQLIDVLHKIAASGATVIVTIHQPPPPVVRKIDNLILLRSGRLLYSGKMGKACDEHFSSLGFHKPDDYNIADWILQVSQENSIESLEKAGFFDEKYKANIEITKGGLEATAHGRRLKDSASREATASQHVGFVQQTRLLYGRETKNLVRDKGAIMIRISSNLVFGLLFGLIFYGIGRSGYDEPAEVQGSYGAMANLLISTMFGVAQSSLMEFPKDRPVFLREYSTNHYSVLPYFLAKFSVECIVTLGQVTFQLVASFWLMGFRQNFLLFLLVNFVLGLASTSIGLFVGSMVENPDVAAELMPALIVPQLLFAGVFIQVNLIPEFLRWAQYLCSLTYAIRLVLLNEFSECADEETLGPNPCEQTLQYAGVDEMPTYAYWVILFAIMGVFRVVAIVMLRKKASF